MVYAIAFALIAGTLALFATGHWVLGLIALALIYSQADRHKRHKRQ